MEEDKDPDRFTLATISVSSVLHIRLPRGRKFLKSSINSLQYHIGSMSHNLDIDASGHLVSQ